MQSPVTKAVRCQSHRSRWTRLPDAKQDRRNLTDHSEKWIGGRRRSLHSSRWPSATLHPPATADTRRGRDRVFGLVSFKNTWLITWKLRVCRFTPASTASCRCARAIASRAATGPSHPTHTQRVGGEAWCAFPTRAPRDVGWYTHGFSEKGVSVCGGTACRFLPVAQYLDTVHDA